MEIISGGGISIDPSVVEAVLKKLTEDEKKAIEKRVSGVGVEKWRDGEMNVIFNYTLMGVDKKPVNLNCAIKKDEKGELVRVDEVAGVSDEGGGVSIETAVVGAMERFYQLAESELAGGDGLKAVETT